MCKKGGVTDQKKFNSKDFSTAIMFIRSFRLNISNLNSLLESFLTRELQICRDNIIQCEVIKPSDMGRF